ncbi:MULTISPECIES: hypothetical protein [Paenibacillus]|uniref:Uncharacterized protein n=1 Tax=Paenibacillus naphthalenovorans TaxID=162209 RepID=A0A0U2M0R1_9BACL|nr:MULTISPECIES: hypothetical protein [Paenibacillus]ALS20496.1 hypothetical protein IJ22_01040 [Paenibacillus naphthalenovorans]NTZ18073.1 hypothetical protein [Paenibacillus sp. JMULE4]GCL73064.1 hypothetical protein PN4B1_30000 [Paenibacillus naphthalenovorans]SDI68618.1 hypothetical protein SAMN05421868_10979 [Paenibacillus naphthalenovorans]
MGFTLDAEKVIHLPDLNFVQFCQKTYGLNRGVYNTVDSWFYQKGATDIADRRKRIIHFLDCVHHPVENGRLKFGHGGLASCLTLYWENYA